MHKWPKSMEIIKELGHDGAPSPDDRYVYAKVQVEDKTLFYKEAKATDTGGSFDNEVAWSTFLAKVYEQYPDLGVRGTRLYSYKKDQALLSEFIEAPLLALPEKLESISSHISRYVDTLIAIDAVGRGYVSDLPPRSTKTSYQQLDIQWDAWYRRLEPEFQQKYADKVAQARQSIAHASRPEPCMQHGDFVPWHIFNTDDEWIIFDAEHAHHEWPRFYDLAYSYSRMYSRPGGKAIAHQILQEFMGKIDMPANNFWKTFLPVLTSRAVGVLSDALYDKLKVDYETEALELLDKCLTEDTSGL